MHFNFGCHYRKMAMQIHILQLNLNYISNYTLQGVCKLMTSIMFSGVNN